MQNLILVGLIIVLLPRAARVTRAGLTSAIVDHASTIDTLACGTRGEGEHLRCTIHLSVFSYFCIFVFLASKILAERN